VKSLVLGAVLLAADADEAVLAERVRAAQIGAAIAFVVTVTGLALGARHLARRAKEDEAEELLEEAYREMDEQLGRERNEKGR
jgi:hypothetical protein